MAQSNTIGGPGSQVNISFTQYGTQYAANYSDSIVSAVNAILSGGGTISTVGAGTSAFFPGGEDAQAVAVYDLIPTTVVGTTSQDFQIATAGYVLDTVGGSVLINDSVGGDSIIVTADNPQTTVKTAGADNLVVFIDGNNLYLGSGSTGGDTVSGGSGNDTIVTGAGNTTVNAGEGYDVILLNDTTVGAGYNDQVFLDTGYAIVTADGTNDYIVATSENQTIVGGSGETSTDNLTVVILPNGDGTPNGDDLITGGAGYLTVGDETDNNTINGGTGGLTFISAANITADVNIGSGFGYLFGNSGVDITLGAELGASGGGAVFIAGAGNETLNGALSNANVTIYGATQADSASANDVFTAGSGNDLLVAGAGSETLTGGAGTDTFLIDSVGAAGASLTIGDFLGGNNDVLALNYSASDIQTALAGGTVNADGNFVITFSDTSTTVTFTGVTSASQLDGHILSF
jgi:Ca2+-binding RTX toxin-like protein